MPTSVIGIVRGTTRLQSDKLENQELQLPKRDADGIPYFEDAAMEIRLRVGSAEYHGLLRSRRKLSYLWVSPKLFDSDGKRWKLSEVLSSADIHRNERIDIDVDGNAFSIRKRTISNTALISSLETLSARHRISDDATTRALADIEEARSELQDEDATTRTALVEARLGQGRFREELLNCWDHGCAVTNCTVSEALIASHIKPWRDATNRERLDRYNGLLLIATLDRLFDAGLITFDVAGRLLVSPTVSTAQLPALGLHHDLRLRRCHSGLAKYLKYHRTAIFRSS